MKWTRPARVFCYSAIAALVASAAFLKAFLFVALVCFVFGASCLGPAVAVADLDLAEHGLGFDAHEIETDPSRHQTVLAGHLFPGLMANLVVIDFDGHANRRAQIYGAGEGSWGLRSSFAMRPAVHLVDVVAIGGQERLVSMEPGRLNWFDPEARLERLLVALPSEFRGPCEGPIRHVDLARDLNGDGLEDLIVPDPEGCLVYLQAPGGSFDDPVQIGPPFDMERIPNADGYRYDPWRHARLHLLDYDFDGRRDLAFWGQDQFEVHLQESDGRFARVPRSFASPVPFDSDDLVSLAAPHGVRHRRMDHQPRGNLSGRVFHSFEDVNGDEIADLAVFSLKGHKLTDMHSSYEVHYGSRSSSGQLVFATQVSALVESTGILFGFERHDFDQDGQADLAFQTIEAGFFRVVRLLAGYFLTGHVPVELSLHRMEKGMFGEAPNTVRTFKTHPSGESGGRTVFSSVLIGDVNGDRLSELLVQDGKNELRVYLGVPERRLFAKRPLKVAVAMPHENYTWLTDLNRDGKQDLLMHHPSEAGPQRVTMLVAR